MIAKDAQLHVERLPLTWLQVGDYDERYPEKLAIYMDLLRTRVNEDTDPLIVAPSETHKGMFTIQNGHHRYCAYIMTGRREALCIIVETPCKEASKE